jgi:ribonuclease E
MVRTPESAARAAYRKIQARIARGGLAGATVYLAPQVALYLLNHKRDDLHRLETRYGMHLEVVPQEPMKVDQFEIEEIRREEPEAVPMVTADAVDEAMAGGTFTPAPESRAPLAPVDLPEEPRVAREMRPGRPPRESGDRREPREGREAGQGRGRRRRRRRRGGEGRPAAPGGDPSPERAPAESAPASFAAPDLPVFSEGPDTPSHGTAPDAGRPANEPGPPVAEGERQGRRRRRRRRGRGRHRGPEGTGAPQAGTSTGGGAREERPRLHESHPGRHGASTPAAGQAARLAEPVAAAGGPFAQGGGERGTPAAPAAAGNVSEHDAVESATGTAERPKRRWWRRPFKG